MATITTAPVSVIQTQLFAGYKHGSNDARAEVRAVGNAIAVAATGAGDNQLVSIIINPPANFAYALVDFNLTMVADTGTTYSFPLSGSCVMQDAAATAAASYITPLQIPAGPELLGDAADTTRPGRTYTLQDGYRGVVIPIASDGQVEFNFRIYNDTANDVAYHISNYVARFLQYDINQAHHVRVNSPIPTR